MDVRYILEANTCFMQSRIESGERRALTGRPSFLPLRRAILLIVFSAVAVSGQSQKYPWQHGETRCNKTMTFCWYGIEEFSDAEVTAHGRRWTSQDKDVKPLEWITEVRCLHDYKLCVLARNQKLIEGSDETNTNIDLYRIQQWGTIEIRAIGETDLPKCEVDTMILNRVEGSVSVLSAPGPKAADKSTLWRRGNQDRGLQIRDRALAARKLCMGCPPLVRLKSMTMDG